jgi:hypothetical protein
MGEVEDLMWQATYGPKGDWALYLYKEHFGFGKHKDELKERLDRKRQDELTEIRTHPDLKNARDFLINYKSDPEAAEGRDILLSVLERTQAGNKESPPPALLRQLFHSGEGDKITYSIEVAENSDGPNGNSIKSPVGDRLRAAIEAFQLQPQAAPESASIRVPERHASWKGAPATATHWPTA